MLDCELVCELACVMALPGELPVKRIMTGSIPMSMPGVGSDGSGDDSEVDSEDADDWGW